MSIIAELEARRREAAQAAFHWRFPEIAALNARIRAARVESTEKVPYTPMPRIVCSPDYPPMDAGRLWREYERPLIWGR